LSLAARKCTTDATAAPLEHCKSESGSQNAKGQNPQGTSAESARAESSDKQSAKATEPVVEFGIGSDWEGDIDSVEVGPNATLTMYDDENYADDARELTPNTRVADLHQALFDEGIESLKLTCSNGATR